ncbi:LLM class flavin-dependent oxidoreductase [Novosphingobium mangrovi (ex Huang et al. 2023)]|uniref:LLM class flavin-dependent oxidoreductase n=1 Tax=Novosphingobium mangrovi (ex Huang et al. 2023) TaxID=2976432 RepID=A0ABT2I2U0_9SPHN|nr:LLM class flavin-dependent oxidoreductase [Novosphingobium mangrovi (ex Huang et al. 2023)]MCT2399119.1 LLM class flavin-dependent oxidoreductase [Novosphingobium mangrovi (ex Huang et al. 2023)]
MELGLLYEFEAPKPWEGEHPWGQRTKERQAYKNCIEQIALADRKGFHTAWLVEHHFREGRSHMPCNDVVLGALSQITENIRLGFGVTLMPHEFIHPVRVAEKVATVDLLSRGRAEWGMGRSTPMEQIAFGVDAAESKKKMLAACKTVSEMWAQEYYEEDSEYLKFPKRMVTPKPYQYPHPPCWMAASSEETIRMAGQNGLGLLCFSIMQPLDKLAALIDIYREEQKNAVPVSHVHTNKVGVYTLVHCTESRSKFDTNRVWDSMWWWYRASAEFILKWEMAHLPPEAQDKAFPLLKKQAAGDFDIHSFDEQDMVIIGTPEECLKKFLKYEDAGIDQVLCYVNFGYLPQEAVLESITLLGDYVIPELKAMGAKRTARGLEQSIALQAAE